MPKDNSKETQKDVKPRKIPKEVPGLGLHPYRLMSPGPVPVHSEILKTLALPPIHHRTPEFKEIFARVLSQLKKVFLTEERVFVLSSTGTGAMEAAIVNALSPGDKVLVIESGKFGERWAKIAIAYGLEVDSISLSWGESCQPGRIKKELELTSYRAVLCQACETSAGSLNPVKELAAVVCEFPQTILMVDGITAVGASYLPMDEWGVDVLIAGSQKAFMLPTGLSMLALSKKAWSFVETATTPCFYWDLRAEKMANEKGQTHFSSPVSLIRGLDVALRLMLENGFSQHLRTIEKRAQATRVVGEVLGLKMLPEDPSPSLTVFVMPDGVDGQRVRQYLEDEFNLTIMGGQDRLKGKVLRIGHMGAIEDEDLVETVYLLARGLHECYPLVFARSLPEKAKEKVNFFLRKYKADKIVE